MSSNIQGLSRAGGGQLQGPDGSWSNDRLVFQHRKELPYNESFPTLEGTAFGGPELLSLEVCKQRLTNVQGCCGTCCSCTGWEAGCDDASSPFSTLRASMLWPWVPANTDLHVPSLGPQPHRLAPHWWYWGSGEVPGCPVHADMNGNEWLSWKPCPQSEA